MGERNIASQENNVISLVERRNKEIVKSLDGLAVEVLSTRDGIEEELNDLKLMANLSVLEDPKIGENVVDLEIYRNNKILSKKNPEWMPDKGDTKDNIRKLVSKIRDAMDFLYNTKFKQAMESSHGLSSLELNTEFDYLTSGNEIFSNEDMVDKSILISLKIFIPQFVKYLENVRAGIDDLAKKIERKLLDTDQTTDELCQLRNQLQSGLHYVEYYLNLFEKNNPSK